MKHGRALMPFGKYRGVRLRLLPDSYLSFLTTFPAIRDGKFWWLRKSLVAELKFRGMRYDLMDTEDVPAPEAIPPRGRRRIILERKA